MVRRWRNQKRERAFARGRRMAGPHPMLWPSGQWENRFHVPYNFMYPIMCLAFCRAHFPGTRQITCVQRYGVSLRSL
jgi:hypothetical protein